MQLYEVYWQQITQVLGWTFLHFLWQGTLIALLYAALRSFTPKPTSRYLLGILSLFAMAIAPALTAWRTWNQLTAQSSEAAVGAVSNTLPAVSATAELAQSSGPTLMISLLPWLGAIWLCGVLLLSLNSLRHWRHMHWLLRHDAKPVPEWQYDLRRLSDRFAIWPRVRLLQSSHVVTPTLIGWLKPIILLPASVLGGFTPQQIEMIIAHELGHVRRWDYLLNLFQVTLETLLFYHPAVHWISRDVRNVRETCCDDLVIQMECGTRLAYAHTLANLEGLRATLPAPALAASGGVLLARVRRIVGVEHETPEPLPMRQHGWLLVLLLVVAVGLSMRLPVRTHSASIDALATIQMASTRLTQQAYALLTRASAVAPVIAPVASAKVVPVVPVAAHPVETALTHNVAQASETLILPRIQKPQAPQAAIIADSALKISDIRLQSSPMPLATLPSIAAAPMPKALRRVAPSYPAGALASDQQGQVTLSFGIAADGSVQNIEVTAAQGAEQFVAAAKEALHQWSFDASNLPSGTERYTQVFDFALSKTANGSHKSDPDCKVSTGSHICRHETH